MKTILSKLLELCFWVFILAAIICFPIGFLLIFLFSRLNMGSIAAEGERYKRENAEGREGPLEPKTIPLRQTKERPRVVEKKTFKEKLSIVFFYLLFYSFIFAIMILVCWLDANSDNPIVSAILCTLGLVLIGWLIYIWLKDP